MTDINEMVDKATPEQLRLAIQDVLELHKADTDEWNLDKCMGCGLNSYEERIELSDCETRQAITNRLGGME